MPETGEEIFSSFLGVPIQRVGEKLGVLVVQSKTARQFSDDEVYALEVVAMVLGRNDRTWRVFMAKTMACSALHKQPVLFRGSTGQEGAAEGHVWLHEARVVVTNPVADDPLIEIERIRAAVGELRVSVDDLLSPHSLDKEQKQVLEAYRMFAHSRGWLRRMEEDISLAFLPKRRWKKNNPPPARVWNRCPTPICATGCMIWMICRTACCAS